MSKISLFFTKCLHYEYWAYWFFYTPAFLYSLFWCLRARSFTYITAANPAMNFAGLFHTSKIDVLKKINKEYLPDMLYFSANTSAKEVLERLKPIGIFFPFIVKPNTGERGRNVEKIDNESELNTYLSNFEDGFIVQSFIDFDIELGVLFYKHPETNEKGIFSVVVKEFLSITGNGKNTVGELIVKNPRAKFRLEYLQNKFETQWNAILPIGESLQLEPIGNHNRGTKFLYGNHLINNILIDVFDKISSTIDGFYWGRYDLKVKSYDDLYAGKNIKIMELNGANSEPAHIYDPEKMNLWTAYRDVIRHIHLLYDICTANHRRGVAYAPLWEFARALYFHFAPSKPTKK